MSPARSTSAHGVGPGARHKNVETFKCVNLVARVSPRPCRASSVGPVQAVRLLRALGDGADHEMDVAVLVPLRRCVCLLRQ